MIIRKLFKTIIFTVSGIFDWSPMLQMKHYRQITLMLLMAALCVAFVTDAAAQEIPDTAGPLVGHTTPKSTSLWLYTKRDAKVEAIYRKLEGDEEKRAAFSALNNPAGEIEGAVYKLTLDGLEPDTRYRCRVAIDGEESPDHVASFKTAPAEGKPAKFRVAVTSCMKTGRPQHAWKVLLEKKPDMHVTLGDTHYSDTTDPSVQWRHHLRYRAVPQFAAVNRNVPTYAIWDDHDYGPNNSDGTAKGKEQSLAGWGQFWANPASGTDDTPGAFYRYTWAEVEFFIVDGRYHRSPDNDADGPNKRMLGDAQFAWLVDGLKNSKAKFKVIASGSTLHDSEKDGWRIYTFARHRLLDAIKSSKVSGVLYLSGDIHRSHVRVHNESDRVGYPLVEVVSSGVANSKTLSFATLDFNTQADDPTVRVRIIHGDGKTQDDKTWKLSELHAK